MFAIVRLNSFDPVKVAASPALEQFDQIHRTQPGYVGTIVIDLQAGRRLVLKLWERGVQRGVVVGRRARGRPPPRTAHVPPV
jgi:hypothetical protein